MVTGFQWSRRHLTAVIAGVVVLLGIAAGILWFIYSRQQAQAAADAQLWKVQSSASLALMEKDAAREDAIRKVRADYDAILSSPSDASVAPLAAYWAASFLSEAGKPAEAAGYFERALDLAGAWPGLRTLAQRGLAESLEARRQVRGRPSRSTRRWRRRARRPKRARKPPRRTGTSGDATSTSATSSRRRFSMRKPGNSAATAIGGTWPGSRLESLSPSESAAAASARPAPAYAPHCDERRCACGSPTAPAPKRSDEKAERNRKRPRLPSRPGKPSPSPAGGREAGREIARAAGCGRRVDSPPPST